MFTPNNTDGFTTKDIEIMNTQVTDLLEAWNIYKDNTEIENYTIRAEELVLIRNQPENIKKRNNESEKNSAKYRPSKVRKE